MHIQCPNCNSLSTIRPEEFPDLIELDCSFCGEITSLKNGTERVVKLQFVLTEPDLDANENILPVETGETFHQKNEIMLPFCFWQQKKVLYEEQHADVQQE